MSDVSESPFIILAPLQGYTDITFRNVFAKHFQGIDQAMAPFISTMGHERIRDARLRNLEPGQNLLPVVHQMMGNAPEDLIFLANRLFDLGHQTVNLNLGCPHTKVAKKKRGSGLLPYPEIIDGILEEMIPHIRAKLSIKLRLGYRSIEEIHALIPILNRHDICEIILHPRTGTQMYQGRPYLDAFSSALEKIAHPVTYNGDIVDKKSFCHIQHRFPGVNQFMLGRGLLSNPFLGEEIKDIVSAPEKTKTDRLYQFHEDLLKGYQNALEGPGHVMNRMKGFWKFLGPSFEDSKAPLKKILKSKTIPELQQRSDDLFDQCPTFSPLPSIILSQ